MSAITIEDELVHYEVLGRGRPVILVHGWLGSWRYWVPTMERLSTKYRCYALDLWGFGDSGKDPKRYAVEKQIDLLGNFIERMGIPKVVLVGHSLGAAVAAQFAANPETSAKVHRMLLVAPPLLGDATKEESTTPLTENTDEQVTQPTQMPTPLTDTQTQMPTASDPNNTSSTTENDEKSKDETASEETIQPDKELKAIFNGQSIEALLAKATNPESSDFEKLKAEAIKADREAIDKSIDAFITINTYEDLTKVTAPVCTLHGNNDSFLPQKDSLLKALDERSNLKVLAMGDAQHFPMLDDNAKFVRLLLDFLEAPDVAALEMQDEWRRRLR